jgi:hypothetical protein
MLGQRQCGTGSGRGTEAGTHEQSGKWPRAMARGAETEGQEHRGRGRRREAEGRGSVSGRVAEGWAEGEWQGPPMCPPPEVDWGAQANIMQ